MALQGFNASIKVQSSAIAMTDEATTGVGNLVYTISNSAKTIMDLNTAVIVEDGGTITSEDYTIDYLNGVVTFSAAVVRVITITGAYVTPVTVATADTFSFSGSADVYENTPFGKSYKEYQAGLITGTASLGRYFVVDDLFIGVLLDGTYKIIEYYVDATHKISFYGLITTKTIDSPVSGLIKSTLDFQITTNLGVN